MRNIFLAVAAMMASLWQVGIGLAADRYPSRPVRFIVPYPPGGGSDITGRAIGEKLTQSLGQTVVIDNRPGATSLIGTEITARAPADGYTIILADAPHTINAVVYKKKRYDAIKDFTPITLVATSPQVFLAHASFRLNSLKELLAMPRAETEKLSLGTSGLASGPHMTYEWLRVKTGLTLNHIPYKGGGPSLADGVAGQIPLVINALPAAMPHIKSARLKVLAVTSRDRHPMLPNSPTVIESGVKDFVTWQWYGILGPAGMSREIVALLNREIHKAMASKEVTERFTTLAFDAAPGTPEEMLALLKSEDVRWRQVSREVKVQLD
jgi:tripartite-type tricarboxylate transporter receptor subunit TctC